MEFSERYDPPMARFGVPALGWLTSLLLCLITFYIFWTFRFFGPEATLHRYHLAAAEVDREVGQFLSDPNFESGRSAGLWRITVNLMAQGETRYALVYRIQDRDVVTFIVHYDPPGPTRPVLVWRVRRIEGNWMIDANQTTEAMERFMGLNSFDYVR